MEISVIAINCFQVALVITSNNSSYSSGFNLLLLCFTVAVHSNNVFVNLPVTR